MNRLQKWLFTCLLSWTEAKVKGTNGYILNSFAKNLAIYLICDLTRDELQLGEPVKVKFETLASLGEHYADFSNTKAMPANRVKEALEKLAQIGMITVTRVETDTEDREDYHFRGKEIWQWRLNLDSFDLYDPNKLTAVN